MEYVGHVPPGQAVDTVVRHGDDVSSLTAYWLSDRRVLAATHLNQWGAMDDLRQFVGRTVDPAELADPDDESAGSG